MSPFVPKRNHESDLIFFVLAGITWLCFFLSVRCVETGQELLLFSFGASCFALLILKGVGYFDTVRLLPRKSDLLHAVCVVPLGGALQHLVHRELFDLTICNLGTLLLGTPLLGVVVFGGYYGASHLLHRGKKRMRVVLDLLPHERVRVIADFAQLGLGDYFKFLSREDLKIAMKNGTAKDICWIAISRDGVDGFDTDAVLLRAHLIGIPILDHRRITANLTGRIRLADTDLWTYVLMATPQTALLRLYTVVKSVMEPVIAIGLAILFLPLIVIIAVIIRSTSDGPVLYRQVRAGYLGRPFTLVKFRTMRVDSEKEGPRWATENDNRVTRVGRFLRDTRLDELPQLWNVARGEMGFFGPRPERPEIYEKLKKDIPLFSMRTIVRPGITGWAQVCAGYAATVRESQIKLEYDLYYIQHMSPRLDMIVLLKTFRVALIGERKRDNFSRRRLLLAHRDLIQTAGN